jgi:hypothetical protein
MNFLGNQPVVLHHYHFRKICQYLLQHPLFLLFFMRSSAEESDAINDKWFSYDQLVDELEQLPPSHDW